MATALAFAEVLRSQPNCVPVEPGQRHWDIFTGLCRTAGAKGNLVPDAFLAALAIESGSERPGLRHATGVGPDQRRRPAPPGARCSVYLVVRLR